jgi:hypothetical protein
VILSSNVIETPKSSRDRAQKKRRKKKKEKKAPRVSLKKREVNILRGKKHFNFKDPFYVIPFSPPSSYHFKNRIQYH